MFLYYSQVSISQIAYSARIEWVSPQQTLVMFNENGVTTTSTNSVTLTQLTPGTTYRFRVSAITQDEERGAEVLVSGTTTEATGGRVHVAEVYYKAPSCNRSLFAGRLAYIQLRISPVASCYFWQVSHTIITLCRLTRRD